MKKTATLIVLSVMLLIVASPAIAATIDDTQANSLVDALKDFAVSGWGKLVFFGSLLVGVICVVSGRYRTFGIVAIILGALLGAYGGLADSLWELFTGSGS